MANSEVAESNRKGARRVKSPKSNSPAPTTLVSGSGSAPLSIPENEDASDAILQLKGHEAEVCDHTAPKPSTNPESIRSLFVLGTLFNTIS